LTVTESVLRLIWYNLGISVVFPKSSKVGKATMLLLTTNMLQKNYIGIAWILNNPFWQLAYKGFACRDYSDVAEINRMSATSGREWSTYGGLTL